MDIVESNVATPFSEVGSNGVDYVDTGNGVDCGDNIKDEFSDVMESKFDTATGVVDTTNVETVELVDECIIVSVRGDRGGGRVSEDEGMIGGVLLASKPRGVASMQSKDFTMSLWLRCHRRQQHGETLVPALLVPGGVAAPTTAHPRDEGGGGATHPTRDGAGPILHHGHCSDHTSQR